MEAVKEVSSVLEGISSSMELIKPRSSISLSGMLTVLNNVKTDDSPASEELQSYVKQLKNYIGEEHRAPSPAAVSKKLTEIKDNYQE